MKPEDIEVGRVYCNAGGGRTKRKVIALGPEHAPSQWFGEAHKKPPEGSAGVLYEQDGQRVNLYLKSFAQWAGRKVR